MAFFAAPGREKLLVVSACAALVAGCLMNPHRGERQGLEPAREPVEQPAGPTGQGGAPGEGNDRSGMDAALEAQATEAEVRAADGGPNDGAEVEGGGGQTGGQADVPVEIGPADTAVGEEDAAATTDGASDDACAGDC